MEENLKADEKLVKLMDENDPIDESLYPENVLKKYSPAPQPQKEQYESNSTHSELSKAQLSSTDVVHQQSEIALNNVFFYFINKK